MGTNTKIMLSFIGGAVTGALICFAVLNEKHNEDIDKVSKDLEEFYNDELDQLKEHIELIEEDDEELDNSKKTYVDYVKKYSPGEIVKERDITKDYPIENENYHNDIPYVITQEDFDEDFDHHDKITITFYGDDGVLADDRDEMITDIDNVIGIASLDEFDRDPYPTVIHVRNERLGADYEVCLLNASYQELILGVRADE